MATLAHTTPDLIRDDFTAQIKAITADHPEHAQRWRVVKLPKEVPGPKIRNFFIECGPGRPVVGGIFCGGCEYEFEMRVLASYGALSPNDSNSIATVDAQQLYSTLSARYAGLDGLLSVEPVGFEEGPESEEGYRWGAHVFQVRYFADV